jgi:hypothetical protein
LNPGLACCWYFAVIQRRYLELCRRFLAQQFQLDVAEIKTLDVHFPHRAGTIPYSRPIDLWWETETPVLRYIHIAQARWRKKALIDADEVFVLQKVKEKVAAHKAFFLTNTGFTARALAVAGDERITALIIKPASKKSGAPGYTCKIAT